MSGNHTNPIQYQATQPRPEPYQPKFNSHTPDATVGSVEPNLLVSSTTYIPSKPSPSAEKKPFHRTRRGVCIIIIAIVVILAAIIGGAVGGSLAKKPDQPILQQSSTNSDTSTLIVSYPSPTTYSLNIRP